jgi:hypothetical protein
MFVTTLLSCHVLEPIASAKLQAFIFFLFKVYAQWPAIAAQ